VISLKTKDKSKISDKLMKNLFDLEYQKYLQYHTITIITMFTYFVGFLIAIITNQINTVLKWSLSLIISILVFIIGLIILKKFNNDLDKTYKKIKKLKI